MRLVSLPTWVGLFVIVVTSVNCAPDHVAHSSFQLEELPPLYSPGGIKVAYEESVINTFLPMTLDLLNQLVGSIVVPPQSIDRIGLKQILVQDITIRNISVKLESPNKIRISVWRMSANVHRAGFRYCAPVLCWFNHYIEGTSDTEIRGASAAFSLRLSVGVDDLIDAGVEDMVIDLGQLSISVLVEGWNILNFVVTGILAIFKKIIKLKLQEIVTDMINPIVKEKIQNIIGGFPIIFLRDPYIIENRMEVMVVIFPNESAPRVVPQGVVLELDQSPPARSVGIVSSYGAANNVLRFLSDRGMLSVSALLSGTYNSFLIKPIYPEIYELCDDCIFRISVDLSSPPWLRALSDGAFSFNIRNARIVLDMVSPTNKSVTVLSLLVNTTSVVRHIFIDNDALNVEVLSMDVRIGLSLSLINGLDEVTLNTDIPWLINTVCLPLINAAQRGYRSPLNLSGLLLSVSDDTFAVGLDPTPIYPILNKFVAH